MMLKVGFVGWRGMVGSVLIARMMEENDFPNKPQIIRNNKFTFIKWFVFIAAYSFLVYKLVVFDRYKDFIDRWNEIPPTQFLWLIPVFILIPINWFLEAEKWKKLVSKFQYISISTACKSVLSGIITGFFTPNRIGDLIGRLMYLDKNNKAKGFTVSIVNSLTQNLIICFYGLPAAILFFFDRNELMNKSVMSYLLFLLAFCLVFGLIYFLTPSIYCKISSSKIPTKISHLFSHLSNYSFSELINILLITNIRYFVFCTQFYLILIFFGTNLSVMQAFIAIPLNYLFVTFTPSIAFSEAAVRSSYALIFIGAFSENEISIILAGVSLWVLNFVIPMIAGSILLVRKKF